MEHKDHPKLYQKRLRVSHYLGIAQVTLVVGLIAAVGVGTKLFSFALTSHVLCTQFDVSKTSVQPNETINLTIKFQNDGDNTLLIGNGYVLNDPYGNWYGNKALAADNWAPGQSRAWAFSVKAPGSAGTYKIGAQIIKTSVG